MLNCTFLPNCGLYFQTEHDGLLIDTPNGLHTAFDGLQNDEFEKILHGLPPYDDLRGMFFTHKHADHYDRERVRQLQRRENVFCFVPNGITPESGEIKLGELFVRYFSVPHSGAEFSDVCHHVFLIEADGKRIIVTGDADWENAALKKCISCSRIDCGIFNPNFISHETGRDLLCRIKRVYINHYPIYSDDTLGIGRKCRSSFGRYGAQLPNVCLVDSLPKTVCI